jgi:hypothetical protein
MNDLLLFQCAGRYGQVAILALDALLVSVGQLVAVQLTPHPARCGW